MTRRKTFGGARRVSEGYGVPRSLVGLCLLPALIAVGCSRREVPAPPVKTETRVTLIKPEVRDIMRTVGQPGFIDAYEQTAIYPKVSGFIKLWKVDIGDVVKQGQVLAQLDRPDLDAEYEQRQAQVVLDDENIESARQLVDVATSRLNAAVAQVKEAKANLGKYEAEVERWQSEVKRLTPLAKEGVVNAQVLEESIKQLKSNKAARDAAEATILAAAATELARRADLGKTKVDVGVAKAKAKVSEAEAKRYAALVGFLRLVAPYDGIITARNANDGDFVEPATGDPSARADSRGESARRGTPIYVVARSDMVRVFVDVPEIDANFVGKGSPARVRVQALGNIEFPAKVTRTSWALNVQSRTLRAEIDLPNPPDPKQPRTLLRPGSYAYGMVEINRPKVMAIPVAAVIEIGNVNCCYLYDNGKAIRTPLQTGIAGNKWIEVARKQVNGTWADFTGNEQIIEGDLSELVDGASVRLAGKTKE
ncbi:MAG: HlyD family efflux transporter periplasmic adaptor subunit [Planctomycetes bacterium]|nr:HlyD family efflux transporter periplasmic adaptor subunit [Planctomycetota bacterium]